MADSGSWRNRIIETGEADPATLVANPKNYRRHPQAQREALGGVLAEVGWVAPVTVNRRTGHLVDGHARVEIALYRREPFIPVQYVDLSEDEENLVLATLDPLSAMAEHDTVALEALLAEASTDDPALQALLDDLLASVGGPADEPGTVPPGDGPQGPNFRTLAEQFLVPPFSILDARQGYWQARKSAWLALGIQSELGRGIENLNMAQPETLATPNFYGRKRALEAELGRELSKDEAAAYMAEEGVLRDNREGNRQRKAANAIPGGAHMPSTTLTPEGKTQRGDSTGKPIRGKQPAVIGGGLLPLDRAKNGKASASTYGEDIVAKRDSGNFPRKAKADGATYDPGLIGAREFVANANTAKADADSYDPGLLDAREQIRSGKPSGKTVGKVVQGGLTYATGQPRTDEVSGRIMASGRKRNLTFVKGADDLENMSEASKRILSGSADHQRHDRMNQHVNGLLMTSDSGNDPAYYFKKQAVERRLGREITTEEFQRDYYEGPDSYSSGTSIFDPVLCELAYSWFCAPGGHVLDPFAGGSVRGITAAYLGRAYTGVDLRAEQVDANMVQAYEIVPGREPEWIVGDSQTDLPSAEYDFIFSCPPYYDLEIYSDDPADLSNMEYEDFLEAYRGIIQQACARLRDNRFACFVVGDIRDKKGNYRNFVAETIRAFMDAGLTLYNEAILVTALGSLPIRAGRQFSGGRKLGKTHQNVLVFLKGDSQAAVEWCGPVEVVDMAMYEPEAIGPGPADEAPAEDEGAVDE
jgi:hypothetical protein